MRPLAIKGIWKKRGREITGDVYSQMGGKRDI